AKRRRRRVRMKRLRLRLGWLTDGVDHWPEWMILAGLEQKHDLVVLQGQVTGDRPLFAPGEDVGEVVAGRQWPMEVLQVARLLAEAVIVISQESRQQFIAGGNRADPLKAQFLDQAILQGLVGTLDAALRLRRVGAQNVDVEGVQRPAELGHPVALDG